MRDSYPSSKIRIAMNDCEECISGELPSAFRALGHKTRLAIVAVLQDRAAASKGGVRTFEDDPHWCRFGELRAGMDVSKSSLSYHVTELAGADLIERASRGRRTYLRVRAGRIQQVASFLSNRYVEGEPGE